MIPPRPDSQKRMAAFDALPVTIRRAMANAAYSFPVALVSRLRRRGLKARQVVAAIAAADRRIAKGGAL